MTLMKSKKSLPFKPRPTLFWDVDPKTIDPKKHAKYIIRRVMSFGNDSEVQWMWARYPKQLLRKVVLHGRGVDKRAQALWMLLTEK